MTAARADRVEASGLGRAALGSAVFFLAAPGTVAGLAPFLMTRWVRVSEVPAWMSLGGAVLIIVGIASLVESFVRFVVHGHGTPAPAAPPTRLVVSGQYRHVRNPMYVALVAIVAGQAVWFGSSAVLIYTGVLWALFHLRVVTHEEPTLARQFGDAYDEYRQGVRRWTPRINPWSSG